MTTREEIGYGLLSMAAGFIIGIAIVWVMWVMAKKALHDKKNRQ